MIRCAWSSPPIVCGKVGPMSFVRVALSLIAVVPASLHAQSVRWEQIWDQPDVAVIYVDRASVAGSGDLRSIATRTVYRAPLPDGNISERIRTEEFDCIQHRSRLRQVTVFTNNGSPPQTQDWGPGESAWANIEPDSLGERKREIACSGRGGRIG